MNNDNEKELLANDSMDNDSDTKELCDGICHCSCCDAASDEEATCDCGCNTKKKFPIVTPVIIAAVSLLLVAAIVLGGVSLYKVLFKSGPEGVWEMEGVEGKGLYFEFTDSDKDGKGDILLRGGGIVYSGTYETDTCNVDKDSDVPEFVSDFSAVEPLSGDVDILKTDFYMLGSAGGKFIYSVDTQDGKDVLVLKCVDFSGAVAEIKFVESKLPEFSIDPNVITNASADEAGITTLVIDNNIVGEWEDVDYGTYTFNSDGTGKYKTKYQLDPMMAMYGLNSGYAFEMNFRYTTGDGKIYFTVEYFIGEPVDGVMTYYLDGDNIVIDNMGYKKVK